MYKWVQKEKKLPEIVEMHFILHFSGPEKNHPYIPLMSFVSRLNKTPLEQCYQNNMIHEFII